MITIKQSSVAKVLPFFMVDSTDHISGKAGLTPSVTISKNGAPFIIPAGTVYDVGHGWYAILPTSADVSAIGPILVHATAAGADQSDTMFQVVAYDPDSAINLGLSNLDAQVSTRAVAGQQMTLTSAYDSAKTAASQSSVNTLATYVDTEVAAILAAVDTEIASILSKVTALPADPADASDIAASFSAITALITALTGYVDTEVAAIKGTTDKLNTTVELDGAVYRFTTNALEQAPVGGGGGGTGDAMQSTLLEVKSQTDQLSFSGGKVNANADAVIAVGDMTAIADAILKRDWTALTGEAAYSLLNAARMLRCAWDTTGGTLTVKKEDGTTMAWQRVLATDPTAQPITGAT